MFVSSYLELGSCVRYNCLNYRRIQEVLGHLRTILGIYDSRGESNHFLPVRTILDDFGIDYGTAYFVCHDTEGEFTWFDLYDLEIRKIQNLVAFLKTALDEGKIWMYELEEMELEEGL